MAWMHSFLTGVKYIRIHICTGVCDCPHRGRCAAKAVYFSFRRYHLRGPQIALENFRGPTFKAMHK